MPTGLKCPECGYIFPTEKLQINKEKLLLVEGKDAEIFWKWVCHEHLKKVDVQVIDFGGVNDLRPYLEALKLLGKFDQVKVIVIIQDAERNAQNSERSIQSSLEYNNLPVPDKSFFYTEDGIPRVAYLLHPGPDAREGTLEHLCLSMLKDNDEIMPCVVSFMDCIKSKVEDLKREHKNKLYGYLSGTNDYVGLKLGEAAYRGAWNPPSEPLQPFLDIIQRM